MPRGHSNKKGGRCGETCGLVWMEQAAPRDAAGWGSTEEALVRL